MVIIQAVFFIFIVVVSFFQLFIHMKSDFLERYLTFILIVSSYIVIIYQIKSVLWLTFVCAAGLIINSALSITKKLFLLAVVFLFMSLYRAPSSPSDFTEYLNEEHGLYCESVECLQIVDHDIPNLQANVSNIQSLDFHDYFFWAKGEITTDEQSIKAINIMGFWFSMND